MSQTSAVSIYRMVSRGVLVLSCLGAGCALAQSTTAEPVLTAGQIVATMELRNQQRADALRGYTGHRVYQLKYRGFPTNKEAELVVDVQYIAPSSKQFTVISQSGSKFIINNVLKRLLASEQEAQSGVNRKETALTSQNYGFALLGQENTEQGRCYVLRVEPKAKNKFLYRGTIWIDAEDFALMRIEAEPAKNPSFWISSTRVEQEYAKVGAFWLPARNQSTTKVRLGGTATLSIDYQDYALPAGVSGQIVSGPTVADHVVSGHMQEGRVTAPALSAP